MSLPAMHTAVGMSFPFLLGAARYLKVRKVTFKLLILTAFFMILCGVWAEVPDVPTFLSEGYKHLETTIMNWKYVNIFFFHGLLDKYQTEDRGLLEGAIAIFTMFSLMLVACSRSILLNQKEIDSLKEDISKDKRLPKIKFKNVVDIHCHVLPGIDDGSEDMEEAVNMCKKAADMGITHMVATPHIPWNGEYNAGKIIETFSLLKERVEQEKVAIKLSLGSDNKISWELIDLLKDKKALTISKSRYFLLELDENMVPRGLEEFIKKCNSAGFYPIITHPERNRDLQSDIERLRNMHELDVLIQITGASLTGFSGKRAEKSASDLLEAGLVDIIASDAHSCNFRMDEFKHGVQVAASIVGPEKVKNMIEITPKKIVENVDISEIKTKA